MTRKSNKQFWTTVSEIPGNHIFMMSTPIVYFLRKWPRLGLGNKVSRYFTYYKKSYSTMNYLRPEFDAQADFLSQKMISRPDWALKVIDDIERWSQQFIHTSQQIAKHDLHALSDQQLIRLYKSCLKYQELSHGIGASVSWHADADKERVTKAIWNDIERHIKRHGENTAMANIFSILSTPDKQSFMAIEEQNFLKLAITIWRNKKIKKLFITLPVKKIMPALQKQSPQLYKKIEQHHEKYCWLNYQYRGPATHIEEYITRWKQLIRSKENPARKLQQLLADRKKILTAQKKHIRIFQFSTYQKNLIRMAQRMVFIKECRKEALYHGTYCYEPLFREIGRRIGLTLEDIWAMNSWEIPPALLRKKFNKKELRARQQEAVAYATPRSYTVLTGSKARQFLKKITFEKVEAASQDEWRGTPACSGSATGAVKIINTPADMKKMKKGDILVAHNTYPSLVPAMKLASALVSEQGGLTCHTAIVARELRTPCIVGATGIISVLKDGDRVEVDAINGIIKKV